MTNFPGDDVPDTADERLTAAMDGGGHGETRREEKKDETLDRNFKNKTSISDANLGRSTGFPRSVKVAVDARFKAARTRLPPLLSSPPPRLFGASA